jgi:hypothetical protein
VAIAAPVAGLVAVAVAPEAAPHHSPSTNIERVSTPAAGVAAMVLSSSSACASAERTVRRDPSGRSYGPAFTASGTARIASP